MFPEDANDPEFACRETGEMLKCRDRISQHFEDDVYDQKKPKGFSVAILREFKDGKSEENIKSISVKFNKYDRGPDLSKPVPGPEKNRIEWTDEVLAELKKSFEAAKKICSSAKKSHEFENVWKEKWRQMRPEFRCDWILVTAIFR